MKNKVLIVPAKLAYKQFKEWKTYICHPNRYFQISEYIAFYDEREIKQDVAKILGIIESFDMLTDKAEEAEIKLIGNTNRKTLIKRLKNIQSEAIKQTWWYNGGKNKFIFLSRNEAEGTVLLKHSIKNVKQIKMGTIQLLP